MQATATLPTTATGRHVLTGLGVLALASSVVPGIVRGSTPQMTASVRANPFVINPQTAQALQGFAGSIATTSSALTALRASHGSLFRRSMILRWKEPAPPRRCPDAAGSDAGRVDVNCPEPKPIVRREKVTLWFDDYLLHSDSPRHDEIAGLTDTFERLDRVGGGAARRLQSRGLKDIRTELIPAELQALGDTDFANAMNFQWSSSEWGVGGPVAFASVFGVSLAAISLLYGLAWKNSPNARPGSEPYRDRRAFLRTVLAGLGAGFGLSNMGGDDNSGAIARGRATIRNAIVSAGSMTDDQLFRRFFQMSPQQLSTTLLANSRSLAQRLNHLNTRD